MFVQLEQNAQPARVDIIQVEQDAQHVNPKDVQHAMQHQERVRNVRVDIIHQTTSV